MSSQSSQNQPNVRRVILPSETDEQIALLELLESLPQIARPDEPPSVTATEILQPPLSTDWAAETEAQLDTLFLSAMRLSDPDSGNTTSAGELLQGPSLLLSEPFEAQFQEVREHEHQLGVATASWPDTHGDPFDKLVGCSRGLPQIQDPAHPLCNECGRRHVQCTIPVRMIRAPGDRREFAALDNRTLLYVRQARRLARLDTSVMDEEITFRILQHPEMWGDLGVVMAQNWMVTLEWCTFERMEQVNDQRDMYAVWEGADRYNSIFPELDPQSVYYRGAEQHSGQVGDGNDPDWHVEDNTIHFRNAEDENIMSEGPGGVEVNHHTED
jgi:hypothetical protein